MMRNWTGKLIFSDGKGWHRPRLFEVTAGSMGQAAKQLLDRYWAVFSLSDKVRVHEVRLTLIKGGKVSKGAKASANKGTGEDGHDAPEVTPTPTP